MSDKPLRYARFTGGRGISLGSDMGQEAFKTFPWEAPDMARDALDGVFKLGEVEHGLAMDKFLEEITPGYKLGVTILIHRYLELRGMATEEVTKYTMEQMNLQLWTKPGRTA